MKKVLLIIILLIVMCNYASGQETKYTVLQAQLIDGDTIPFVKLKEVEIFSLKIPKTRKAKKRLTKLVKNIKIVYPYAKLAGIKLREYEEMLINAPKDKERKKIMKQAEKEINEEYGGDLRELNFSQGKILIKLIDRETGRTSYQVIKELKGGFTAFFWQGIARIFGNNLKTEYDPEIQDKVMEDIVLGIEAGYI